MKILLKFFASLVLLSLMNCGGEPTSNQNTTDTSTPSEIPTEAEEGSSPIKPTHDCEIAGEVLENNSMWLRDKAILVAIVADSSTYDEEYGNSHRIFVAYNTDDCSEITREVLPINESPDFPYYLAKINYNKNSQLVAIKGFNTVYCYDIANQKLLASLEPVYMQERYGSDASAGTIQRLEIWENYLIGAATEFGCFAFDLSDPAAPKPIKPFAEFQMSNERFASLFLLDEGDEGMQLILPDFDIEKEEFAINPVFDKPKKISTNVSKKARNNRFLVLREENEGRTPIAIDLEQHKAIKLPTDIAAKKTQDILKWMKER